MQNKDLVSVIIPTLNRPSYLAEAVKSVISQTYPKIEIIIIDDGSDDNGKANKKVLEPYLSSLKYVYQENQGIGASVNKGISLASGEFIQRLDDDDMLAEEKIEKSVKAFQSNPDVGMVVTGYYIVEESGNSMRPQMPLRYPKKTRVLFMLMSIISAQVSVMVRRICHDVVGLYRTDILSEDYEMWVRIAQKYDIATIDEPLAFYRRHKSNITRLENVARLEKDTLRFMRYYLEEMSMEELLPDIRSEAYGYVLKAAVYLVNDGIRIRTVEMAREKLDRALELEPYDPLIRLWKLVLRIHGDSQSYLVEDLSSFGELQAQAEVLIQLDQECQALRASHALPSSPEMTDFRRRYGKVRNELIKESYRRAIAV